nr:hypothetical protein [Parafrankia sp. CH37]
MDVRPDVTLPEFGDLELVVEPAVVSDEKVEEYLGTLRDRFAVLKPVERAVQEGDFVSLDLSGRWTARPSRTPRPRDVVRGGSGN